MATQLKVGLDDYFASGKSVFDAELLIVDTLPDPNLVSTFPANIFPPDVAAFVEAAASSMRVPVEVVAVPLLVFAGAVIGNRRRIRIKKGYEQYPTLYAGVIADPGSGKTPATMLAAAPLFALQRDAKDEYLGRMALFEEDLKRWEAEPKGTRGPAPEEPQMRHVYTTNPTVEGLAKMLETSQGIAVVKDELSGWVHGLNQYRGGSGDDRQHYLSMWSNTPIKADRKGQGSIYVEEPVIGIYGGITPDTVKVLNKPETRDGWPERILLYRPDIPLTEWTDDEFDETLADPVIARFRHLRDLAPKAEGGGRVVELAPEALPLWREWFNDNSVQKGATSGMRRGVYAKYEPQLARLALVLHALWDPERVDAPVPAARLAAAIDVIEFFREHLERVLPLLGEHSDKPAPRLEPRIIRILRRAVYVENAGWVPYTAIYNGLRKVKADELRPALKDLETRGIVEQRIRETGTKPVEEWRIQRAPSDAGSENSEDSPETPDSQNSQNGSVDGNGLVSVTTHEGGPTWIDL